MQVYCDKIPGSKTEPHRGFTFYKFDADHSADFTHTVGTLSMESPGRRTEFLVDEIPVPAGRGFHLAKLCGAIGDRSPRETAYDVEILRGGGWTCSCE